MVIITTIVVVMNGTFGVQTGVFLCAKNVKTDATSSGDRFTVTVVTEVSMFRNLFRRLGGVWPDTTRRRVGLFRLVTVVSGANVSVRMGLAMKLQKYSVIILSRKFAAVAC